MSFYSLKIFTINGTSIGTDVVKTTPEKNAITDISELLLLFITGRRVSIAVAPAVEIDSKLPINLAINGIVKIDKISLKTLLRKATLPSSGLIFDNSIADNEYQPSPEETAKPSPIETGRNSELIKPPKRDPKIVDIGRIQIFLPYFFKLENTAELSPISIPTKNRSKQRPKSIKVSDELDKNGVWKNKPIITPKTIDKKIPIIYRSPPLLKKNLVIKILPKIEKKAITNAWNPRFGNSFIILLSLPILYPITPNKKKREKDCKRAVLIFSFKGINLYLLSKNPKLIIKIYNKILNIAPPKY